MIDPMIIFMVALVSLGVGVQQALYHCADAELHGGRMWWSKALFRAKQRVEYREFCRNIEEQKQFSAKGE